MRLVVAILLSTLAAQAGYAADAKPTEASVRQLLEIMHTNTVLDTYMTQIDSSVHAGIQQQIGNKPLNAKQRQIMDDMGHKMVDMLRGELSWTTLEPRVIEVYRDTFTQAEVSDMLKFYGTPTGQAVVNKLPQAMRAMAQYSQEHVQVLIPKLTELQRDTAAQLKAAQDDPAPADAATGGAPALLTPPPPPAPGK